MRKKLIYFFSHRSKQWNQTNVAIKKAKWKHNFGEAEWNDDDVGKWRNERILPVHQFRIENGAVVFEVPAAPASNFRSWERIGFMDFIFLYLIDDLDVKWCGNVWRLCLDGKTKSSKEISSSDEIIFKVEKRKYLGSLFRKLAGEITLARMFFRKLKVVTVVTFPFSSTLLNSFKSNQRCFFIFWDIKHRWNFCSIYDHSRALAALTFLTIYDEK